MSLEFTHVVYAAVVIVVVVQARLAECAAN